MNNHLTHDEIELMKESGAILKQVMREVGKALMPGVSTYQLDKIAAHKLQSLEAESSFKNYEVSGYGKYPSSICTSLNDEIVHGVPSKKRILKNGDIISIDIGVNYKGYCTDAARTYPIGKIDKKTAKLLDVTKKCLDLSVAQATMGNRIGAIGHTVETLAKSQGFSVVRDLVGHGVGKKPHMDPQIPNFGNKNDGCLITQGMALAIEPMLTSGSDKIKIGPDGWALKTKDGSMVAHFEDTVIVTEENPLVITQ